MQLLFYDLRQWLGLAGKIILPGVIGSRGF
jgi:hypothetical protein